MIELQSLTYYGCETTILPTSKIKFGCEMIFFFFSLQSPRLNLSFYYELPSTIIQLADDLEEQFVLRSTTNYMSIVAFVKHHYKS